MRFLPDFQALKTLFSHFSTAWITTSSHSLLVAHYFSTHFSLLLSQNTQHPRQILRQGRFKNPRLFFSGQNNL